MSAEPPPPTVPPYGEISWERMIRAVEKVRRRLERATSALESAGVPYAVAGGNAVAAWVSRVDEAAVRNTQDVDILLRRADLDRAKAALEKAGFSYCQSFGIDMFLDGPDAKPRDAVHVVFAGEKVRQEYVEATPDVSESDSSGKFTVVSLDALVRMKLTSYRLKDRVHVQDLIEIGLLDASWQSRLAPPLAARLQELLDDPNR